MDEEQVLSFRGMNVSFRVYEPEGLVRHRILLIPGPLSDGSVFAPLIPLLLSVNCLIVCADLPGFGRSAVGAGVPMGAQTRASILWGILDHVDREISFGARSWHVLAHGSAAYAALEMAAVNPESVLSHILIGPVFSPDGGGRHRHAPGDDEILGWYDRNIVPPAAFRALANYVYDVRLEPERLRQLHRPLLRRGVREELPRLVREGYRIPREHFGAFTPMLILRGENDVFSNRSFTKEIAEALKDAEVHRLEHTGHCPMETHPEWVMDYLRGWLRYLDE